MQQKPFFSDTDTRLIRNYLLGGLTIGAGTGAATALANYLSSIKRRSSEDDDSVLKIKLKKDAEKSASVRGGLAISGGILGTMAGYALAQKIYKAMQRKEAQKDLDAAQIATLDLQGYEPVEKKAATTEASKPMSGGEWLAGSAVAFPVLLALASGAVSYNGLKKMFPAKKVKVPKVRRVVVEDEDPVIKVASEDSSFEFLYRYMDSMDNTFITKLANVIASEGSEPFRKIASSGGFMAALDTAKNGHKRVVDPLSHQLAISYLTKASSIKHQVRSIVCAEYVDKFPELFKIASTLPEEDVEDLVKIASILGDAVRGEVFEPYLKDQEDIPLTKEASSLQDLATEKGLDALISAMRSQKESVPTDQTPEENILSNPSETEMSGGDDKKSITSEGPRSKKFIDEHTDVIDALLSA